jgi:RNA binding exosome subunit
MSQSSSHIVQDGIFYVRVDPQRIGSELESLKLAIRLAGEKIAAIKVEMAEVDEDSEHYDQLQDQLNDYELMISDFEDRVEDLILLPPL